MNYNSLMNKPTINYRELIGDNTVNEVGGITEEQFNTLLNTDLSSYYTKAQIDDLFSRSFVYREKSGSIVTFDCPSTSQSIPEVTVGIEATQDLHGYDSPWVGGAGKNKLENTANTTSRNGLDFTVYPDGSVLVNGTATASTELVLNTNAVPTEGNYIISGCPEGGTSTTYWINYKVTINGASNWIQEYGSGRTENNATIQNVGIYIFNGAVINNLMFYPMIRLATETDPTFAPYSNICPISGWSAVNVYDGPTTDPQDATVYTIDLDGTRYGGTLDVVSGVLTLTHGYIASYNGETLPSTWISDRDVYAEGTTPTIGAEVVYKLATPQTIQLTPTAVKSLLGTNNLWADSGDIIVKALDKIIQG